MKRVTIYDVAKEADVSLATVSRVINGSEVVKGATKEKVEAAIKKMGYKPNAIAQGLALQKTTTIALVIPEASYTYTGQIINGLLDVAKIYKYNTMIHTTTEGISEINEIIENIIKSRVDGVIIYNDRLEQDELAALTNYNMPIVVIGNKMSGANVSSVFVDIKAAICELVTKYLETGVKDVAILQDRKHKYISEQMELGAKAAYEAKGLPFDNYIKIDASYRTSFDFCKYYLNDHRHEVIIANRDSQAIAISNASKEHGIKVPEEMEIVCVLDTKYNTMARPQISSFAIPSYDLGAVAMRVMTKMLAEEEENSQGSEIELSYLFTPRQSTK